MQQQPQPQPQVHSRDNLSSPSFGSHLHQRSLSLPHKLNASPPLLIKTKRGVLPIVAAYSGNRGDSAAPEPEPEPPAKALRRILELPGVHQGPACFDALSAKLVERAGFHYCFTSGM